MKTLPYLCVANAIHRTRTALGSGSLHTWAKSGPAKGVDSSAHRSLIANQGASHVDEREMMFGNSLPANSQCTEVVVPAVRTLDNPAPGLLTADRAGQRWFSSTTNMRSDMTTASFLLGFLVVVSLVQAHIVGHSSTIVFTQHDRVERLADHMHVVDVGARQRYGERDTVPVGQDVAFCPELSAIGRVGPGELPPFGAFTEALSRDAHAQSMPTCWS